MKIVLQVTDETNRTGTEQGMNNKANSRSGLFFTAQFRSLDRSTQEHDMFNSICCGNFLLVVMVAVKYPCSTLIVKVRFKIRVRFKVKVGVKEKVKAACKVRVRFSVSVQGKRLVGVCTRLT